MGIIGSRRPEKSCLHSGANLLYRRLMLRALILLIATLLAAPALAGATEWQELAPGAKARLISAGGATNGTTLVALELDMPPSMNTYWRVAGETGIPTELDFTASQGVASSNAIWPYPQIHHVEGYRDYVYFGPVVLPVELSVTRDSAVVELTATMGICSDVCVPARAHFTLPLDFAAPDAAQALRIRQALVQAPIEWDKASVPFVDVRAGPGGLELRAPDGSIDPDSLIADLGNPAVLFGAPQKSPDENLWKVPLLGGAEGAGLAGRTVQLTFLTPDGPYSVSRTISPAE